MMRGAATLLVLAVVIGNTVSAPPEPDPDPKTYGYITTFQVVDEEDLPVNTKDMIMMGMKEDFDPMMNDPHVMDMKHQMMEDPFHIKHQMMKDPYDMKKEMMVDPNDMEDTNATDVDTKAAIQTAEIVAQGEVVDAETGKVCVKKVMMREETRYEEVMTCDHSYDERCHTSYVTSYQPHQEEECEDMFKKVRHKMMTHNSTIYSQVCFIYYQDQAVNEVVNECVTQNIKDCSEAGEDECRTVYDTTCETTQEAHDVVDDVVNCRTENVDICKPVTNNGVITEEKCELWPQEKCEVTQQTVKKYSPKVKCKKILREICSAGCAIKEVRVS